jgi:hypothetical protein
MVLRTWADQRRPVPEFQSEGEEREFWAEHDSTEFIDWEPARRRKLPNLKPTLRTISLRLPVAMIEDLKVLAHKRTCRISLCRRYSLPKDWRRSGAHKSGQDHLVSPCGLPSCGRKPCSRMTWRAASTVSGST